MTLGIMAFYYALSIAYLPEDSAMMQHGGPKGEYVATLNNNVLQPKVDLELTFWDIAFIGASYQNKMVKPNWDNLSFLPYQDTFTVRLGLRVEMFEFGFEHLCSHPLYVNSTENENRAYPYSKGTEASYDKFYVTFTNRSFK